MYNHSFRMCNMVDSWSLIHATSQKANYEYKLVGGRGERAGTNGRRLGGQPFNAGATLSNEAVLVASRQVRRGFATPTTSHLHPIQYNVQHLTSSEQCFPASSGRSSNTISHHFKAMNLETNTMIDAIYNCANICGRQILQEK